MLFENWKHSSGHQAKLCTKKAGFSAFFSHGKFKLLMEKSLNFIAKFLCEPCISGFISTFKSAVYKID